ncbi:hypothetical protein O0L34_g2047 [Tuta absoluta]|nr:hypothetical protein O0L34_g2047 [Tuta absoluta]
MIDCLVLRETVSIKVVSFPSTRLLLSHRRIHLDEKPHACRYCDKRFRHESTLRTHERTHTGERPYVCAACGKRFIQNSNLTLHMRTHTGDRPYSCDTCGRSFSSGSTLKSHLLTHTGEKPYECRECGKRFVRKDMRAHMRTHSGERPFSCGVCTRRFLTAARLRDHCRVHTGSRAGCARAASSPRPGCATTAACTLVSTCTLLFLARFSCGVCTRRFLTAARLRDHCRVHTGEKPFECAQCSLKFGSKSHLVKHMKTHQVKRKRVPYKPADQTTNIHERKPEKETERVELEHVRGEGMDTKEVIQGMPDVENVTEEIVIQESQADDPTPVCLTTVKTAASHARSVNVVTVEESGAGVRATAAPAVDSQVKLYQVDQSVVQIHAAAGQLTISKYTTSKLTANL